MRKLEVLKLESVNVEKKKKQKKIKDFTKSESSL